MSLYNPQKEDMMGIEEVKAKYGVLPEQVPDYLALTGDKIDNGTVMLPPTLLSTILVVTK